MTGTVEIPIACALDTASLEQRLKWIAELNARALVRSRREDLSLALAYRPDAIDEVQQMVAGEQACCDFLTFAVSEQKDIVHVLITAPEAARGSADSLFSRFASTTTLVAHGCDCVGRCGA